MEEPLKQETCNRHVKKREPAVMWEQIKEVWNIYLQKPDLLSPDANEYVKRAKRRKRLYTDNIHVHII